MRALLSLLTALSLPAVADALTDPTQPAANWRPDTAQTAGAKRVDPKLTSILVSHSRRVAVIDGTALGEGESANGVTVVRIEKTSVDALVHDVAVRLSLYGANVTKELR